jgi:hypothetical protein
VEPNPLPSTKPNTLPLSPTPSYSKSISILEPNSSGDQHTHSNSQTLSFREFGPLHFPHKLQGDVDEASFRALLKRTYLFDTMHLEEEQGMIVVQVTFELLSPTKRRRRPRFLQDTRYDASRLQW